jgi:predicted RNA-binding protein YlxR (DUF448 family)
MRLAVRDGVIVPDTGQALPGRGAYVCPEPACARQAVRRGGLPRRLRVGAEAARELEERLRLEPEPGVWEN